MSSVGDLMIGFDHAVVLQRNLEAAATGFERLGFRVSGRNVHPGGGTANNVIQFRREYLELLTVIERTPMNEQLAQLLELGGSGLRLLSLGTADAAQVKAGLDAQGIASFGPHVLSRTHRLEDGTESAAEFVVTVPMPVGAPLDAHVFVTEHRTPQFAYAPNDPPHPNGTVSMRFITVPVAELAVVADKLRALTNTRKVHFHPDFVELDTGTIPLRFVRQGAWTAGTSTAIIGFGSIDMAQTRAFLAANDVLFHDTESTIEVGAESAFGVSLLFEPV